MGRSSLLWAAGNPRELDRMVQELDGGRTSSTPGFLCHYWIPLYQVLEQRGFQVCLVNARHLKNASNRSKTDRLDCQWIQRQHSYGLQMPSFRPKASARSAPCSDIERISSYLFVSKPLDKVKDVSQSMHCSLFY